MAGAIYFDLGRASWLGTLFSLLWVAVVCVAYLIWHPVWQPFFALLAIFSVFLLWWFSQQPSNDRLWNANFAQLAHFNLDGDTVTAANVRNTEYVSLSSFEPHFETRTYQLSQLVGVDAAIVYWGSPWLCHPMLIFNFGEAGRLCMSIEVRYRVHQKYSFLRSLYRQQEIIYVVSDERDAILKRTKYSHNHDVYLYHLCAEPEEIRKVFLEYVMSTNDLVQSPRWYHGLTTNCTTSIYRQRSHQVEWDWRWLFNGRLDEMIYDHGRLDTTMPFEELKKLSRVNDFANQAPRENFGDYIRERLAGYTSKQGY